MLTTKDNTRLLATAGKGNESAQAMQSKKIEDQQKSEKTKLIKAQIKCEQFEIKSQESDLTSTEKKEMDNNQKVRDQMLDKYSAYKEMNSEEMIKTYEDEFKESFTGNISAIEYDKEPGKKSLEELYEEKFPGRKDNDNKAKNKLPLMIQLLFGGNESNEDAMQNQKSLYFESSEELTQFLQDAAAEGIKMRIMDENGKVMAYSNGDGKLYHADNGLKFETGDSLRSSDMFLDEFIAQQTEQAQQNALPTMKP